MNTIADYDLGEESGRMTICNVLFTFDQGGAMFQSQTPISVNGKNTLEGRIRVGDVLLIDYASRTAVLVLPKRVGHKTRIRLDGECRIGRNEENDICLKDPFVSGNHCYIWKRDDAYFIQDRKSTNGTIVNNVMIGNSIQRLSEGDVIKIGPYFWILEDALYLLNRDDKVILGGGKAASGKRAEEPTGAGAGHVRRDLAETREYPFLVKTARTIEQVEVLDVEIEDAPKIGEKPSMRMAGIAMNWAMAALSLGFQGIQYLSSKKKFDKLSQERAELYNNYMNGVAREVQQHLEKQVKAEAILHPHYQECMEFATKRTSRMWEKNHYDADFLQVRVGSGEVPAKVNFKLPHHGLSMSADEYEHYPDELAKRYERIANQPIAYDLRAQGNLGIAGQRTSAICMVQAMLVQIASMNSYDEVKIMCVFPEEEKAQWEFVRWLPHAMDEGHNCRFLACSKKEAEPMLSEWSSTINQRIEQLTDWKYNNGGAMQLPHLLVVVADPSVIENTSIQKALFFDRKELGVTGIFLGSQVSEFPNCVHWMLQVNGNQGKLYQKEQSNIYTMFTPEPFAESEGTLDYFARKIAPVKLRGGKSDVVMPSLVTLLDGIHVGKVENIDVLDLWRNSNAEKSLAVPIGVTSSGTDFYFDIHEKAHGPHGVVAGMTGSGKTEMVQTWITMMALQFSPEDVNFVLVDFKGSGLIEPFRKLPHLAGTISNLDKDISRNLEALKSEMSRRMSILKVAKSDILRYHEMRKVDRTLESLPFLILVFDEFADFRRQYPEYIAEIDTIFREGRSLGVYVVIMTQKPSGIITEQIRSNVNFRWCLKVQSESDSKEIIDKTDAAAILNPGRAYVKTSTDEREVYELVQSFYSGGTYDPEKKEKKDKLGVVKLVARNGMREASAMKKEKAHAGKTELATIIQHIETSWANAHMPGARQIWAAALPETVTLSEMMPSAFSAHWDWENEQFRSNIEEEVYRGPIAMLGLIDDPAKQATYPMEHDFWKDGSLALYGAAFTGKTVFLQTLITSLALRYTPGEVQMYLIDGSGFGMRSLEVFPHVGTAAGDDEPDMIQKILETVLKETERRKQLFRKVGAGSPLAYCEATGEILPSILVIADNLNLLLAQNQEMLPKFISIAREGVARGIYLVCSFSGVLGINMQLTQNIKKVAALALSDAQDYYSLVGRVSKNTSDMGKGRGYARGTSVPLQFQTALPMQEKSDGKRIKRLRDIADQMRNAWKGDAPTGVKVMPQQVPFGSVQADGIVLGLDANVEPLCLTPSAYQGMLISHKRMGTCEKVVASVLKQFMQSEGCSVYVVSERAEHSYGDIEGVQCVQIADLDERVEELTQILRDRQKRKQAGEGAFALLVIVLEEIDACRRKCDQNTMLRLESYVNLGKGLGVFLIATDDAARLYDCYQSGDLLIDTLKRSCPLLMLEGHMEEHKLLNPYTIPGYQISRDLLGTDEGYLYYETWRYVKIMDGLAE